MEVGYASSSTPTDSSAGGLRFDKTICFGGVGSGSILEGGGSGRPPKRGRGGLVHGGQPSRCQVEGCRADLSEAKSYYSKHKVCGTHSKSPMVIVAGLHQRFCQQCSRFHRLAEFDQIKRSCRRRLAGHNERRRKPPFGSLFSQHYGNLASLFGNNGQTERFLVDFTQYPYPPSSRASKQFLQSMWHSRDCFSGDSDSNPALSLLSNQPSGLGLNNLFNSNGEYDEVHPPCVNADNINGFSSPWGFKGDQTNFSSSLFTLMPPQSTHHSSGNIITGSDQLEIGRDTGRSYMGSGYDSSVHDVHWTL